MRRTDRRPLIQSNDLPTLFSIAASGNDTFDLSDFSDIALGYGGNDIMYGRGGNDIMYGQDGNDNLWGDTGGDYIDGGSNFDYARYDYATSGVYARLDTGLGYTGEAAFDVLKSIEGLVGSPYPDTLVGDAGGNALYGAGGDDWLYGLDGDDTLSGGIGSDHLSGGAGDDTAVYSQALGSYSAFENGEGAVVSGPDGFDVMTGVEHLRFADGTVHVVDGNPIFDTAFYMRSNLDVFHSGSNALQHFNSSGWHEGRDPNPFFDTSWYLATNPDVRASGKSARALPDDRVARRARSRSELRRKGYLMHNPDVAAAGVDPLAHFLQFGILEGRANYKAIGNPVNGFDAAVLSGAQS